MWNFDFKFKTSSLDWRASALGCCSLQFGTNMFMPAPTRTAASCRSPPQFHLHSLVGMIVTLFTINVSTEMRHHRWDWCSKTLPSVVVGNCAVSRVRKSSRTPSTAFYPLTGGILSTRSPWKHSRCVLSLRAGYARPAPLGIRVPCGTGGWMVYLVSEVHPVVGEGEGLTPMFSEYKEEKQLWLLNTF